jgi:hypothetical protein
MTRMLFLDEGTGALSALAYRGRACSGVPAAALRSFADDTDLAPLVRELTLKSPEFASIQGPYLGVVECLVP